MSSQPLLPRAFPGRSAGPLSELFFGENSWEFFQEFARLPLVLVVPTTRKEWSHDLCVFRQGGSLSRNRCQNAAPLAGRCPASPPKPSGRWPQKRGERLTPATACSP